MHQTDWYPRLSHHRQRTRLQNEERARIQQVATTNEWFNTLQTQHPDLKYSEAYTAQVIRYLQEKNLPSGDIQRILHLLQTTESPCNIRPKTDPLQRSVEVIGESATDVLEETLP